jgi:hypothetical protein
MSSDTIISTTLVIKPIRIQSIGFFLSIPCAALFTLERGIRRIFCLHLFQLVLDSMNKFDGCIDIGDAVIQRYSMTWGQAHSLKLKFMTVQDDLAYWCRMGGGGEKERWAVEGHCKQ